MPNRWSKQAYVQGFDCESIQLKNAVNIFEHMEIENIFTNVYQNILIKNIPGYMPTVMVKSVTREQNPPHLRLTLQQEISPARSENAMYIA